MCIRIYSSNFFKKNKQEDKEKEKESKEEKRISVENLMGYNDIVCKLVLWTFYLIESWISPGCLYEFNVVYVQQQKSQFFILQPIFEVHTCKNKNKIKSLRDTFVYHFLFYICLFVAANLLKWKHALTT